MYGIWWIDNLADTRLAVSQNACFIKNSNVYMFRLLQGGSVFYQNPKPRAPSGLIVENIMIFFKMVYICKW